MLKIVIVDRSAEARTRLRETLSRFIGAARAEAELIPRIDLRPLSLQELRFHETPDICVIGPDLLLENLAEAGTVRRQLPDTALVAFLTPQLSGFATIEQLARLGIDDTVMSSTSADDFLRKIVLLARRAKRSKPGKLIVVDSGKGGLGVTSVAAALADSLVTRGKRVALLDFDSETQDLSRFLQVRPFMNENLQLLLDRQRPVTQEYVEQCLTTAWESERGVLACMPPVPESEDLYSTGASYARTLVSVLEILDARFDCVIADVGSARGSMLRTLYRCADKVLFLVGNDAASLYASVDRLAKLRSSLSPSAEIVLVPNAPTRRGLPNSALMGEINAALGLSPESWCEPIPHCPAGQRWPGSGGTLYSQSRASVRKVIDRALAKLGLQEESQRAALPVVLIPRFLRERVLAGSVTLERVNPEAARERLAHEPLQAAALPTPVLQIEAPRAATPSAATLTDDELLGEEVISNR